MASAAYAMKRQNSRSDADYMRSRFRLIEGGRPNVRTCGVTPEVDFANIAPYVPDFSVQEHFRPHPKHFGFVCFALAAAIALAICVVSMVSSNVISSRIQSSVSTVPSTEYVVVSGDSLWSIAETHPMEGHSASEVVTWIMERNGLEGGLIVPGQHLAVPSQSA